MMMSTERPPRSANRPAWAAAQPRESNARHERVADTSTLAGLRGTIAHDASLARYTSWRVGGPADLLFTPADRDDLAHFLRSLPAQMPVTVLGLGSNVLVRDGGIRGAVVIMHNPGAALAVTNGVIYADAGVASPKVARFAALHGCEGAEFLAGIPGTVGGALAMNAGCYGGETWPCVARVETLSRDGTFDIRTPADYSIGYRSVLHLDRSPLDALFTAAWFRFPQGDVATGRTKIKALLARRIATQPLALPNAGSVFRNPLDDHAARLIESCGLKGYRQGGASVSTLHANFIVNAERRAAAADIEALIAHVREVVRAQTGISLEPEVRVLGEYARGE
ncbi:MAG TPA: UDP-N-acetylmuramate dehydrogenase [Casimicrobiaceae bacterium]|nr:UDP-N-acetylmuramate dehydrogenase [Casimicrobiaceae bacterium]